MACPRIFDACNHKDSGSNDIGYEFCCFMLMKNFQMCRTRIDLCLFVPCFPAFFDLLISLGQKKLIIVLLKRGPNIGRRRVFPYSLIKLLDFCF